MKRDVHDSETRLESIKNRIENDKDISENNKKILKEFEESCKIEELGKLRIAKLLNTLLKIAKWLNKDFDKVDKKDIERLIIRIQENGYSEWTKHDYKVIIKKFYSWLRDLEKKEYPLEVKWIKTTIKKSENQNLPNEIIKPDEIDKVIEISENPRDKAFVSMLFESGCRISELLNIKIKDINFENDYAMINVMGKTGNREIPISKSIPLLKSWLNYHLDKENKEAYLFPLEYRNSTKILKKLFEKAKIDKPYNPHQFRHSRASELAKQLTESQMNQFFGWTQSSGMARIYVHLTGRDLIPKLITQNKTKKCYKCGFENPIDLKFCSSCLMPLDSKQFKEKSKQEDLMKNMYKLAIQDKVWLDFTTKRLQKLMK